MHLDSTTSPAKSNLTQTGQMLKSIVYHTANGKLTITFGNPQSEQKASYVSKDRPFMNLAQTEEQMVYAEVDKYIDKLLKSF